MSLDNPDIYKIDFNSRCKKGYYKGALVVDPFLTYHFFRQDRNGYWSQKNGHDNATNLDGDGYLITDPKYAKPTYEVSDKYKFCNYFCVPSNKYKKSNTARIDKKSNQKLDMFIEEYNSNENKFFNKVTFKNFVNDFFSNYVYSRFTLCTFSWGKCI